MIGYFEYPLLKNPILRNRKLEGNDNFKMG